jgi:uncharacterized protein DUF3145
MRSQGKANLVLPREAPVSVYGVLQVHSAPPALCPHIEWAVAGTVGATVSMPWVSQPAAPGSLRAELTWKGKPGTAGAITSALAGWKRVRFEITEEASPGCDAMRYCYTPNLGLFAATTSANGDILVPENKLRAAMSMAANGTSVLEKELERLLGAAWDDELEVFRRAGDGAPVRWLNATG